MQYNLLTKGGKQRWRKCIKCQDIFVKGKKGKSLPCQKCGLGMVGGIPYQYQHVIQEIEKANKGITRIDMTLKEMYEITSKREGSRPSQIE